MSGTVIFRGAFLRFADFRRGEAGWFTRMHFTADFTTVVAEAMGWGEVSEGITSAKLEGQLVAQHLVLLPNDPKLHNQERQLDCELVSDFSVHEVSEGESTRTELRFVIRTAVPGAEAIIGDYARKLDQSASQLRVSYAKQETLDFDKKPADEDDDEQDDASCVDCENGIGHEPNDLTLHLSGQPCNKAKVDEPAASGPALLPARQFGGTHQAKSKRAGRGQVIDAVPVN